MLEIAALLHAPPAFLRHLDPLRPFRLSFAGRVS